MKTSEMIIKQYNYFKPMVGKEKAINNIVLSISSTFFDYDFKNLKTPPASIKKALNVSYIQNLKITKCFKYQAKIEKNEMGFYTAHFPDLKGCISGGYDLENAQVNALWALAEFIKHKNDLPPPKTRKGKNYFWITIEL